MARREALTRDPLDSRLLTGERETGLEPATLSLEGGKLALPSARGRQFSRVSSDSGLVSDSQRQWALALTLALTLVLADRLKAALDAGNVKQEAVKQMIEERPRHARRVPAFYTTRASHLNAHLFSNR